MPRLVSPSSIGRFAILSILVAQLAGYGVADSALAGQGDQPFILQTPAGVDPASLRVTVFAEGLFYPFGMAELADGSLLVATSVPTGGGYFDSSGELIRLVDADGDGLADGPPEVLAGGLPGALTAVRRVGTLVFAVSAQPGATMMMVLRVGDEPADPLAWLGAIELVYPQPMDHGTYEIAVRALPDEQDQYELFFNVGSIANDAAGGKVSLRGLIEADLTTDAAIYRTMVDDSAGLLAFAAPELIATGLRNAAGLAFHPKTGDLLIADNGIDTPADRIVALSADELNRIAADDLGGVVEEFGFPTNYVDYQTGERVGNDSRQPEVAFVPVDGSENEGTAQIAIVPTSFPEGLNDGVLVSFHGQWDDVGLANEENPLVYVDLATGDYVQLVGNDEASIGHLDGLMATDDAVFAADLTGTGSLIGAEPGGVIYRIAPAASS